VSTLPQQEIVAEAEPGRQAGKAFGVDYRCPQSGQLTLVGGLVGAIEVLGRDQLEDGIAQVLEPLVIR